MAKTKNNGIERLRADAIELDTRLKTLGREAGRTWALDAGAATLKQLAALVKARRTVPGYVSECAAHRLGLPGRLYLDLYGPDSSENEGDAADSFWHAALWGEGNAIRDLDVAEAFIGAALEVWAEVQAGC